MYTERAAFMSDVANLIKKTPNRRDGEKDKKKRKYIRIRQI